MQVSLILETFTIFHTTTMLFDFVSFKVAGNGPVLNSLEWKELLVDGES